jgi:hypothetical protein
MPPAYAASCTVASGEAAAAVPQPPALIDDAADAANPPYPLPLAPKDDALAAAAAASSKAGFQPSGFGMRYSPEEYSRLEAGRGGMRT